MFSVAVSPLFPNCLQLKPWQWSFWLAWGEWTLWHFTPWNVAAHGITSKCCSLWPWQLMTKIQPSHTCLCRNRTKKGLSKIEMFGTIKAERLCSFPLLFCLLVLTFNHVIKCTLLLSCLHRPDYIFNWGFIDVERLKTARGEEKAPGLWRWDDKLPYRTRRRAK